MIVKLRGTNTIVGGEEEGVGSNDGTAGIHVSQGATLKVTSEQGDGSTEGSFTAKGGGSKYGGAGIGCSEGGTLRGTILISGGNVTATGGHEGAGIGIGDGAEFAKDDVEKGLVKITGGTINATGGSNEATRHVRGRLRPVPRIRWHGTERYHLALARG